MCVECWEGMGSPTERTPADRPAREAHRRPEIAALLNGMTDSQRHAALAYHERFVQWPAADEEGTDAPSP
jgi:hypothetical protein